MAIKQLLTLSLLSISSLCFAADAPYVVTLTGALTEDDSYHYGVSAFDTKGAGNWGLYAELLFAYKETEHSNSGTNLTLEDSDFSMTIGATYGFTDSLYGLVGAGLRFETLYVAPSSSSSICDDDSDETSTDNGSEYCSDASTIDPAGQIGLLYVTPLGLSLMGAIDTQKTMSMGVGYQF